MGIELPPELAGVAAQAGVAWPEADEEAMAGQARAWREAAAGMSTVATEADTTVRGALSAVRGDTGTAAAQHWQRFVEPDSGHLTSTVRGMNEAADRLEHASRQVGAAKVEIVRNLVALAQNADAAHTAAAAGHPTALAGLDVAIRGTSVNVANIESNLVDAVRPASGVDMSTVRDPVNANPGTHGPASLVTDTVTHTVAGATNLADHATRLVTDTAHGAATVAGDAGLGGPGPGSPGGRLVGTTANLVGDTAHGATHLAGDTVHGATHLVGDTAHGATQFAGDTADRVTGSPAQGQGAPAGIAPGVTGGPTVIGDVGRADPDITGPVPVDDSWTDAPTPPTGQTVQAGFAGGADAPAANPATNLPPAAPAAGGPPVPNLGGASPIGGTPAAPAAPGGVIGGVGGGSAPGPARPAPAAPVIGGTGPAPGAGMPGVHRPATPIETGRPGEPAPRPGAAPAARLSAPGTGAPGANVPGAPGTAARPADSVLPDPRKGGYTGAPPAPPGLPVPAAPVKERDEALALFWVHMFPIGHMPVAADRPARQLPAPPAELDYAAGMRFEPGDHPRTDLVDSAERRAALREGVPPLEPSGALPADAPEVAALAEGHDPLGGENERDWDRRYLVRFGSVTPHGISREGVEFAWPPGERYPEGGSAEGEAEVLEEGTEIDRFGRWEGRVFAAAGTPFAQRSLPPAHLERGYRRYRVLRLLPVWRALSAAWFAQRGGGVRYRTTHSAMELQALGYLADITGEDA